VGWVNSLHLYKRSEDIPDKAEVTTTIYGMWFVTMSSDSTHSAALFGLQLLCNVTSTRTADDKNSAARSWALPAGSSIAPRFRSYTHTWGQTEPVRHHLWLSQHGEDEQDALKKFQNVFAWCSILFMLTLLIPKLIEIVPNNIRQYLPHKKYTLSLNIRHQICNAVCGNQYHPFVRMQATSLKVWADDKRF
jgi:hypothetical protein